MRRAAGRGSSRSCGHHREGAHGGPGGAVEVEGAEDEGEFVHSRIAEGLEVEGFDDVDAFLDEEYAVGGEAGVACAGGEPLEGDGVGAGGDDAALGEPLGPGLADSGDAGCRPDVGGSFSEFAAPPGADEHNVAFAYLGALCGDGGF